MAYLDHVREVRDPARQQDVLATEAVWQALAVPALERLPQRRRDGWAQPEAFGQQRADRAMCGERLLQHGHAARDQVGAHHEPPERAATAAGPTEHVAQLGQVRGADVEDAGPERDVIAEHLR
jgi:hypothetical protein